ncbi:unnamed protein product [Peronospora belbahrii]|uniref:Transmembrane protein n=1 Tax=Peronospora belbahrii TaxID=622444 RepID=A0ABN8CWK3_9STRA|nr:unnamed protein product [Peronospora belbahrii]
MQTSLLPTCDEYDSLDAHLEELEEPGTTFLQDFIIAPQLTYHSNTPLSNSNGYTSEESDYSVVTPTDEQDYEDTSFLQAANTIDLVNVVGDLSTGELMTDIPTRNNKQENVASKVIKEKTSKYRGVTQTSKTSWGAKYSAKRITNTCKTPEKAAHAYDEYLRANYPHKFSKFANFCNKCGKFVNPLRLPQYQSECRCSASSRTGFHVSQPALMSPKKEAFSSQQIMTPTATTSLVPPIAVSPADGPSTLNMNVMETSNHVFDINPAEEEHETFLSCQPSNLSVSSLKSSFLEDTEQYLAESLNYAVKMSLDRDEAAINDDQQQQLDQKRDSLPMAVISSAGDSFTRGDNLDRIIKDINCSFPSPSSLLKSNVAEKCNATDNVGDFTANGSSSESGTMYDLNSCGMVQVKPITSNSLDFDVGELDELTQYFLSENDAEGVAERKVQVDSGLPHQDPVVMHAREPQYKKIHSLDFDSDKATTSNSCSDIAISDVKLEVTETMNSFEVLTHSSPIMPPGSPSPAIITIQTRFLDKYWRNDRKNIQCFPYCPEHGDYYRVRIEDLQHRCKGVCRAPVKAHILISAPAGASVAQSGLLVLARCNSIFSRRVTLTEQQTLSLAEMKSLQSVSAIGMIDHFVSLDKGVGSVQFGVIFHPDVWKFEFDLPKKRRYAQNSSPTVSLHGIDGDADGDPLAAEFMYFFEIDVFYSRDKMTFERLGHVESMNFQIGNTRTLLRQRNKMVEDSQNSGGSQTHAGQRNDSDKVVNPDELPEKKKVKVHLGQCEVLSGDDGTLSGRGRELSIGCIKDEGNSLLPMQILLEDNATPMDTGTVSCEGGDSDHIQQAATYDYQPYVSPRQECDNIKTADSPVATAIPVKLNTNARSATPTSSAAMESYSLHKLLCYAFECVLLSVLLIPVGVLLLLGFLVIPPAAKGIVSVLDSLSDMELSRANSSCISKDQRFVLNRLVDENMDTAGKPKVGTFRYHGKSEVWGRILYFSGAKFVVSMVSLMPAFVLALMAGFLYPIRPASAAIANATCACVLWSREYTRKTTGKRLAGVAEVEMGELV